MDLHRVDILIIAVYMLGMVVIGFIAERRARGGLQDYFLGGNRMPWWVLSMSNATTMFDVSGTMWLVSLLYVYGLKSVFIPWLWPVFNQIFLMAFLSLWVRRSGALTGAEWITLRFGSDRGATASRISVVIYALVSVIAFTGYAFVGIAKFAAVFLPDVLSPNAYALIIVGITTLYTALGGLYGVVLSDLVQFLIKFVCSLAIGIIAMQRVSPEMLAAVVPPEWFDISFGWVLDMDWSQLMPAAEERIFRDGTTMFGAFFMMMVFKGIIVSLAGPAPNYDMQRILAAKSPREAALMSGMVTVVLFSPRFFMVAGIAVIALTMGERGMSEGAFDFEKVLPIVIRDYVPTGLSGLLIAGFLAAFMSTFSGTINAATAYVVNDVYKQYARPYARQREYVYASYVASVVVVVAGCTAGLFVPSVAAATDWIVSGLWVGYAAPNVLKWYWWRLNGYGYFWGMVVGIGAAIVKAFSERIELAVGLDVRYEMARPALWLSSLWTDAPADKFNWDVMAFPSLFGLSLAATIFGSLLTAPEQQQVLLDFYARTRPWGAWGPIREAAIRTVPGFEPNRDWPRDVFNVVVGIIWQTSFVALPIYLVIRDWPAVAISGTMGLATSAILKFTWYDRLESS
jgi:SSS family solute:Na+ symporter